MMFDGYQRGTSDVDGVAIAWWTKGSGPPLLLIHGYPQTHVMWHGQADALAERFTVVAPDLRGYGDSGKPPGDADHGNYSKRTMAADLIAVMADLGHARFAVAGHDRGARVAYRMALDHPAAVSRIAVLDIVPTKTLYDATDRVIADAYFHWFMLTKPSPIPEALIGGAPDVWLDMCFGRWAGAAGAFTPDARAEYRRGFACAEGIHATCEDYRAGATVDCADDAAALVGGAKIAVPLLVLWGARGLVGARFDPLAAWRDYASDVRGHALPCGHFLPEEAPGETLTALLDFFG
jgi:haloacetate dehalogenase